MLVKKRLRKLKYPLKKILQIFRRKPYQCPICHSKFSKFRRLNDGYFSAWDKYGFIHSIFYLETFNLLNHHCPNCNAADRDRLYAIYFQEIFKNIKVNNYRYNFLDIAPEPNLAKWFRKKKFLNYRSVDLYMETADDKADITDLNIYESEKFDFVLCSHVLEHIPDDKKAISEIYRILKPNGKAIIMVPILLTLETDLENEKWTTEEEHWKFYGQNDHVRMYSKNGFLLKLSDVGFKIQQLNVLHFGANIFMKYGIHERSVLYIVSK